MADEKEVGAVTCSYKMDCFTEANEVKQIIESIPKTCETVTQTEAGLERLTVILDKYQEQPHLLDPHLESFTTELLHVVQNPLSSSNISHQAFKYLYLITKVRGPKCVARLFPHEVEDVEIVLGMLGKQNVNDHQSWETRYVLLLWLSIVCMVPFDMSKFDGNLDRSERPIVERILDAAKMYLDVFDKSRDAAALVIAKFVTRPDVKKQCLSKFLSWSLEAMSSKDANTLHGTITMTGILTTLALLFKHGQRADLITYATNVRTMVDSCEIMAVNNSLLRKLYIKLIQRLGLTFLKPRVAAWRYQRGTRSLSHNLANPYKTNGTPVSQQTASEKNLDLDEDFDVPEDTEDIIEQLLIGLKDKDTVVRWSAAKGVGRMTGRLPKGLADEIVGAVLDFFSFQESGSAWHGGCLALAELGRRGLLLPQRLSEVVPVVLKALQYDERRGASSVGSNVRDAACYVCWSFARAYEPEEIKPYVNEIASGLLITSLFDRDVNCRRAASAAFQENVGRQGTFPHGIDILTAADYFAVGKRTDTYLTISVFVAQYEEYCRSLIDHLYKVKLSHWDIIIRELVSKALCNLTARDPLYMANQVLPAILPLTVGLDLSARHGSILCSAEITHALSCYGNSKNRNLADIIGSSCIENLEQIVSKLTEGKLFRGLGGELMRSAVCHLIEKLSSCKFQNQNKITIEIWQQTIDDNLDHQHRAIQVKAVDALPAFTSCYYQTSDGRAISDVQETLIDKYIGLLKSPSQTSREGFSLALGALPKFMLDGKLMEVIESLLQATVAPKIDSGKFSQSRADALHSIANITTTVGLQIDGDRNSSIDNETLTKLYQSCFVSINDYTTDSRGDVGAWVREASMSCLLKLTLLVVEKDTNLLGPELCHQMMCCLLKQTSEKIDRTRSHAGKIVLQLLYKQNPVVPNIPNHERLLRIFRTRTYWDNLNWSAPADCFPKISQILEIPCYQYAVLSGLVMSAGGLTESLHVREACMEMDKKQRIVFVIILPKKVREARVAIGKFLINISSRDEALVGFANNLVKLFREFHENDRVIIPLFNVLDYLLSNGSLSFLAEEGRENITETIYDLTKLEVTKIPDARKIITSINVFSGLLQFSGSTRQKSLQYMMILLCHKYPRVRKSTADSLYTALITYEDIASDEGFERALDILSETLWEEDIQKIRPLRNKLCELFGVPKPVLKNAAKPKPVNSSAQDPLSSYKDLVTRMDY